MNRHIQKWRAERLSKGKRDELLRFNQALYRKSSVSDDLQERQDLATKNASASSAQAKPVDAVQVPATTAAPFKYLDANGIEQTIDLLKVKNLGDTAYAESQKLFPNATQCYIGQEGIKFDDEGRQNVIGENLVILQARHMTKGEYGPWFLLQCAHPELGEISIPAPGTIANEAVAAMSGVDLQTGKQTGPSELPVWARFEFVKGGKYGGYFVIMPAIQELAESAD